MPAFSIGVDLGGTNLRIAAIATNGAQLETISVPSHIERGREEVIAELTARVRSLIQTYSSSGRFLGLGIGVPGIIDLESGTIHSAANLPGWQGYAARSDLESKLQVPVILENDANCAALGEKWLGAGRGVEDLCMITLGTGVGGGFVFNGKPWHGMIGMAGELGHMTVFPDGIPCACGNTGCLEQYASATAIKRMATEAIANSASPELARCMEADPKFSARTVFQCALDGDAKALEIFAIAGTALGIVLANLINAFNLPLYVVGG